MSQSRRGRRRIAGAWGGILLAACVADNSLARVARPRPVARQPKAAVEPEEAAAEAPAKAVVGAGSAGAASSAPAEGPPGPVRPPSIEEERQVATDVRRWSASIGSAVIADNTSFGIVRGDIDDADGDAGGWIHSFTVGWIAHRFDWGAKHYKPDLELLFGIGFVDEDGGDTFLTYRGDVAFRWRDFPWNRVVFTTVAVGVGAWYADELLAIDVKRHPGEERAHFKFHGFVEVTFAPPRHRHHEIVLFNDHWSGAHVVDEGGIDAWGIGYRFRF